MFRVRFMVTFGAKFRVSIKVRFRIRLSFRFRVGIRVRFKVRFMVKVKFKKLPSSRFIHSIIYSLFDLFLVIYFGLKASFPRHPPVKLISLPLEPNSTVESQY